MTLVGLKPGEGGTPGDRRCGVGKGWWCRGVEREETERGGWVIIGGRSLCAARWEEAMVCTLGSGDDTDLCCCCCPCDAARGCAIGPNPNPWSPL